MSVVCRKFLLKLTLRTYNLLKLSHASTLCIWNEEIQTKSTFGTRKRPLANAKVCVTVQFLFCFILNLRAISKYRPPGLYFEERFNGVFFALRVWAANIWTGLFSEFYGNL